MTLGALKTSMCPWEGGESEADKPNRSLAPRMDRRYHPVAVHRLLPGYLVYVILLPFYWKRPREHPMEIGAYAAMWQEEEEV